jgi:hypothetical protein
VHLNVFHKVYRRFIVVIKLDADKVIILSLFLARVQCPIPVVRLVYGFYAEFSLDRLHRGGRNTGIQASVINLVGPLVAVSEPRF